MIGYYKTSDGEVVGLEQQDELHLYDMNIIELVIPDGCETVYCFFNQLKELIIPDGCLYVSCFNNQLKKLILHDECKWIWADMKSVTELNKVDYLRLWI